MTAGASGLSAGQVVIARYFDNWRAADAEEQRRKARFDAFVDRAATAGIDRDLAEEAGTMTLQRWEGWSHHALTDFDYPWINGPKGFKTQLEERLEAKVQPGPLKALLNAIFGDKANDALLRQLGKAAGFEPSDQQPPQHERLQFNPEWEAWFVNEHAKRFETKMRSHGDVFRLAWQHASDPQKLRILDVILGPGWREEGHIAPVAHLSDMEYLIEGVTGITGTPFPTIAGWASNPIGSLFDKVKASGAGYRTKYMSREEREEYRLTIDNGRVTLPTKEPLKGDNIYVLAANNYFYGGAKQSGRGATQTSEAIHHSSFMAGEPVNGAGHFVTNDSGDLQRVDDQSGHYRPGDYELGMVLYFLQQDGTDLSRVRTNSKAYPQADGFLANWTRMYFPQAQAESPGEQEVSTNEHVATVTI